MKNSKRSKKEWNPITIGECKHDYEFKQGWDDETYSCKKCGHRYKLYYEDMK